MSQETTGTTGLRKRVVATQETPVEEPETTEEAPAQLISTPFWLLIIVTILTVSALSFIEQPQPQPKNAPKLITKKQLAQHGPASETPYLAVLGQVFDVSRNKRIYGKDGGYHFFCGLDGSRAFVTGDFTPAGLIEDVADMTPEQMKGLIEWRDFYNKDYTFVAKLSDGAFYDRNGRPLALLAAVEAGAQKRDLERAEEKAEEKKNPTCNSKWSQKDGGEVWCSGAKFPRKVFVKQKGSETIFRCACMPSHEVSPQMLAYPGCDPAASRCQTSPPSA